MSIEHDIQELSQAIESGRQQKSRMEGSLENEQQQAKKKFGTHDLKKLTKIATDAQQKAQKLEQTILDKITKLKEEYEW